MYQQLVIIYFNLKFRQNHWDPIRCNYIPSFKYNNSNVTVKEITFFQNRVK